MYTSPSDHSVTLAKYLISLGAHIGHLYVEAHGNMCYYMLGVRSFFIIIDTARTVTHLKKAYIFIEQIVHNFGNVLFCYSDVSALNIHIRLFFIQMLKERNQSSLRS